MTQSYPIKNPNGESLTKLSLVNNNILVCYYL